MKRITKQRAAPPEIDDTVETQRKNMIIRAHTHTHTYKVQNIFTFTGHCVVAKTFTRSGSVCQKRGADRVRGWNTRVPDYPRGWHRSVLGSGSFALRAAGGGSKPYKSNNKLYLTTTDVVPNRITFINLIRPCQWFNG